MNHLRSTYAISALLIIIFLTIISCEKDITVSLPQPESKIVVEGHIEPGQPPFIMLTRNMPFFAPTATNTFENSFVHNAIIKISNGTSTVVLTEFCSENIPDSLLPLITGIVGEDVNTLRTVNYCLYSTFDNSVWGQVGKTYSLSISAENKNLTAVTTIPPLIPLDSTWFKVDGKRDSLGYIWCHLTDPDTLGNYYRFMTKRLHKDAGFVSPFGASVDDKLINGKSFDFNIDRGSAPGSDEEDDHNIEKGYFKKGDTVVLKWCTIDKAHYDFWRSFEVSASSNGNPFAAPASVQTNIHGPGLGIWGGYGATFDTIIAK